MSKLLTFLLPVLLSTLLLLVSKYAHLPFPPPYAQFSIEKEPTWRPPPALSGNMITNRELEKAKTIFSGKVVGPETIKFDKEGTMYLFTEQGIMTAKPTKDGFQDPVVAIEIKGGRPLSGAFDAEGNLYFCDVILVCTHHFIKHELIVLTGTWKSECYNWEL